MRKTEHIHIHALLVEITRHLHEEEPISVDIPPAYDELETRPASIHKPKDDHREAIMVLSGALEPCLEGPREDHHEQPVNR